MLKPTIPAVAAVLVMAAGVLANVWRPADAVWVPCTAARAASADSFRTLADLQAGIDEMLDHLSADAAALEGHDAQVARSEFARFLILWRQADPMVAELDPQACLAIDAKVVRAENALFGSTPADLATAEAAVYALYADLADLSSALAARGKANADRE